MKTSARNTFILILLFGVIVLMYIRYLYPDGSQGFESAPSFTMYYADWCPHCKTIKPVFKDWSSTGSMTVGGKTVFLEMVEADSNPEKLKGVPVKGYPTFLLKTSNGQYKEFDGERTPEGWASWLASNV
jgi:thiol-disulfide isomerase/thioredoxin